MTGSKLHGEAKCSGLARSSSSLRLQAVSSPPLVMPRTNQLLSPLLIGPKSDPAGVSGGGKDIVAALKAIKDRETPFISRGDRAGTHVAELNLWKAAGIDIEKEKGPWYKSIGQGMGAALNTASASNAYVLSDRGTWLSFKNRGGLAISVEGDK